jgi:lysylphosphatidylglycerol synthetase-like protein (DUF2156 family)
MATQNKDLKSSLNQLEVTLEEYFVKKAPTIPENIKEIIVNFAPWITLVILIITLPAVLFVFGLGTLLAPFSFLGGIQAGFSYTLSMIVLAVSLVLEALAIPGLFKRSKGGWNLVFYASIINAVSNLISFNIVSLIVGTLISWYILFQVKSYYK